MTALETSTEPDAAALEAFGDRMMGILNGACTALMLSIGDQTGLFDALAAGPATSQSLADRAQLNERYVREWLNALTVARVVTHDPAAGSYTLPAEHAAWVTTAAGPTNLARTMRFLPMLAEVEQGIVDCFRHGGGLSYDRYPRFHALDGRGECGRGGRRAGGRHRAAGRWSARAAPHRHRRRGHRVRERPRRQCPGPCLSSQPLRGLRLLRRCDRGGPGRGRRLGLTNATFEVLDVATLTEAGAYDLVTAFDAIHDQAHPATVLAAVARSLRPGGTFLMVDLKASSNVQDNLDLPLGTMLYTFSTMHCMTVSLGLGGDGLGTAWGHQLATSMLHDAGFTKVRLHDLEDDPFNTYFECRRD